MSNRGELIRQRNKMKALVGSREPVRPIFRALIGDGTGGDPRTHVRVADDPARMYVRVDGRGVLEAAIAPNVPMRHDVPVYVGPTQENPDVYEILGVNYGEMQSSGGYAYIASHHWSHEFGSVFGADDIVWVDKEQFLPFLGAPTDPPSMEIYVYPGFYLYLTDWQYFPGGNADLTGHLPAAGLARYVLVSINAVTNVLALTDGADFAPFPPSNPATRIPACPAQHFPIDAVYLLATTTEITWDNIYDVRLMVGGGVNTEVPGPHHLIDDTVHDDTVAHHVPVEGDMILANADTPPAWDVLAAPGAAWRFLRSTATSATWTLFDWDGAAGAGGDMVHDHSSDAEGGSRINNLDQLSLDPEIVIVAGSNNVAYYPYIVCDPQNALFTDEVVGISAVNPFASQDGTICFIQDRYGNAANPRTRIAHNDPVGNRQIHLASGADTIIGLHPILLIRNDVDGDWYEIGWTGSSGGVGAHNILSATHSDSHIGGVQRGAIITGQVNHPGAVLAWTRLDFPGDRHHLQTDDQDVIWDLDISMEPGHWIGLGDATGYGTGLGRITFFDGGSGRDVIANLDADVGVGTEHPNIAGEAVAVTIESPIGVPTLELSRLDDILPADSMVGVIRWFSGVDPQLAVAQIDVVQSGYYESDSAMEFWVVDDGALELVLELYGGASVYGRFHGNVGIRRAALPSSDNVGLNVQDNVQIVSDFSTGLRVESYRTSASTHAQIRTRAARGTESTPGAILSGDNLLDIHCKGWTGAAWEDAGRLRWEATADFGGVPATHLLFMLDGDTEYMRLNSNGLDVTGTISTDFGDAWDLEDYHAGAPTPDGYVRVDINGVTYRLAAELVP